MKTVNVNIPDLKGARDFVNIVSEVEYEVDLESGKQAIDAKSILGVVGMAVKGTVSMVMHSDDEDDASSLVQKLDPFIVKKM